MKTYQYGLIGVLSFLIFLISSFPAKVAYGYWKQYLGNQVPLELQDVEGSVWNGKAAEVRLQQHQFQRLHWDLSLLSLLTGTVKLNWEFALNQGEGKGVIGKSLFGGLFLRNVKAGFHMKDLAPVLQLQALSPEGVIRLKLDELEIEDGFIVSAQGNAVWQNAQVSLFKTLELGSLQLDLEPDQNGVKGVIKDQGGPLEAQGLLNLDKTGQYNVNGSVRVRDPLKTDLNASINALGRAGPDGKIPLNRSGKLPPLPL